MKRFFGILVLLFLVVSSAGAGDSLGLYAPREDSNNVIVIPKLRDDNRVRIGIDQSGEAGVFIPGNRVNQFGNRTEIQDRKGARTTISPFGNQQIIRHPNGNRTVVRQFGEQTILDNPEGRVTIRKFGNQTIIKGSGGQSTTIRKFGPQTIVTHPNGQTEIIYDR
jgi:hypothetical protein